jgi:hypothetical protein
METSENHGRPVRGRRLRVGLSDLYPLPVRSTLLRLLWAAGGCDEAIDYVQRIERESAEYFRSVANCCGDNLDRWMTLEPYHLARIYKIRERAHSHAKKPKALTAAETSQGSPGRLRPAKWPISDCISAERP